MSTKTALSADMKIADIVTRYPETKDIFTHQGFGSLVSEEGMRVIAPFLSLKTALRRRFISESSFLESLEEIINREEMQEVPGLEDYAQQGKLSLLALMPCGLKMAFARTLSAFIEEFNEQRETPITYAIEGNLNQELSYYPYVDRLESVDELPDIIVSSDFNALYGKRFHERFVATGAFSGYDCSEFSQQFIEAGIKEPQEAYSVITVNPLIMVVNIDKLAGRAMPTCWDDLLNPEWKQSVVLRGGNGFFCHAVLLPTYKKHGAEGLRKLADNICSGLHPSQMIKQIDNNGPGAIYVMPAFFTQRIKNKLRVQTVWPEDGALASPVTLQVKSAKKEQLKPLLDFLTGPQLAQALTDNGFPVPRQDIEHEVQHKPLLWLGWDYLYSHDLPTLNTKIDEIFMPELNLP